MVGLLLDPLTSGGRGSAQIHHWDKLRKHTDRYPDPQPSKDLASLLNRVKTAPEVQDYFKARDSYLGSKVALVAYENLWTFFSPGSLVVARLFQGGTQILKVQDSPIPWDHRRAHRIPYLTMWAWAWDWDGKKLMKIEYKLKFDRFRGTKPVSELPFYPLEFDPESEALIRDARARSLQFLRATFHCEPGAAQMFRYSGLAYADQHNILSKNEDEGQNFVCRHPRLYELGCYDSYSPLTLRVG